MEKTLRLNKTDLEALRRSANLATGGISAFTSYWFGREDGVPRWDLVGQPPDTWKMETKEYVPWVPLPWQIVIAHDSRPDGSVIGGFGAQPVTSRVFDAGTGEYVTIAQLIEQQRTPLVLSKSRGGWALARASEPYYEGKGPMYRITTESGRMIDASPLHRLLTSRGYVRISDLWIGDALVAPDSLPAIACSGFACAPPDSRTPSGCQDCCLPDRCRYDAPPRPGVKDDLLTPQPSLANSDDNPLSSPCDACSHRPPRQGSIHLEAVHAEPGAPRRYHVTSGALARPPRATQVLRQYEGTTSQYWQGVLESGCIDLVPRASSCDASGRILWTYHDGESGATVPHDLPLSDWRQSSECHVHLPAPESSLGSYLTSLYASYSSGLPPCSGDWWDYTTLDTVSQIEYIGEMDYYDLHVPGYSNYVAEGVVHHNCGKTIGMGAAAVYWAALTPNFRFMNVAPVGWQSKQMYLSIRHELVDWDNRHDWPTRITKLIVKMVEKPYPKITWYNGSTMEFMSADEQGQKILSWSGDAACIDEAGKIDTLDELLMNLGTRLRGAVSGRERMGKLIVMANADWNPELWARYDMGESAPGNYFSIHLRTADNPYITKKQRDSFERRIRDPQKRRQYLDAERPMPRGQEFTPEILEPCMSKSLDAVMDVAIEDKRQGYIRGTMDTAGIHHWEIPAVPGRQYIMTGDPGQGHPPHRNSPCIMVFDCTDMPSSAAELRAMWWGDGRGSPWPFIYKFEEYYRKYQPIFSAFDATGTQQNMDTLVFQQRGLLVEGLDFSKLKMQMVITLKLLMARGMMQMPEQVRGIWMQLSGWHMPDRKLRQDIACTLFMAAHVLQRLFVTGNQPDKNTSDTVEVSLRERNVDARRLHRRRNERRR